ncbi:MAG TPA: hypothetical protein VF656_04950 [Pyrinomonadaceae bacterium]|jgi:hypothetical protein
MKHWLLLFLLAAVCCVSAACGGAKTGNTGDAKGGAAKGGSGAGGNNAAAAKPLKDDVVFAREAVEGLLGGDVGAAESFDWENLKVPGADAGAAYRQMPDEENRSEFQKGFIEKFSESFKRSGARADDLKNWREQSRASDRTIVAVDTKTGKTMHVFVVRRDGRQLVSEMAID